MQRMRARPAKPCALRRGRVPDDLGPRRGQSRTDRTGAAHQVPARDRRAAPGCHRPRFVLIALHLGSPSREHWTGMPGSRRCGGCRLMLPVDEEVFLSGIHPAGPPHGSRLRSPSAEIPPVPGTARRYRIPRDRDRGWDRALGLHPGPDHFRAWPPRGVHRSRPGYHGAQACPEQRCARARSASASSPRIPAIRFGS